MRLPSFSAFSAALSGALLLASLPSCGSPEQPGTGGGAGGPPTGGGGSGAGGGTGGGRTGGSGDAGPAPGPDSVVTPFDKTHIYFTGSDNQRQVDAPASFPKDGAYAQIILHLTLECPQGGRDSWDRFATIGLVAEK